VAREKLQGPEQRELLIARREKCSLMPSQTKDPAKRKANAVDE
jgi:hypothetical protein